MTNKVSGKAKYFTESRPDLRLGMCNRVSLIHRKGLLAACLSTIVVVAKTDKIGEIRQSSDAGTSGERTYPNFGFW